MSFTPGEKGGSESSACLECWFCESCFSLEDVLQDGIIRSRGMRSGGPYRVFMCPSCLRENMCERTPKGRWFSSPNLKISFLDHLFAQVAPNASDAETLLAAISWLQENEERRRYFFERDGDPRYRERGFLHRLWPLARSRPEEAKPRAGARAAKEPRVRRKAPLMTPHEILGVRPDASEKEIHEAFRRLAIHYHPDKVYHKGEEFEHWANIHFRRLKDAYEALLRRRAGSV
jgi:DnaJ-domain-containing protein 1